MLIQRRVVRRKDQSYLSIPAVVRTHLGVSPGADVYWHVLRKGEVTVSAVPVLRGGRPRAASSCAACAGREEQLARAVQLGQARRAAWGRQYFTQGYEQAVRYHGSLADQLHVALSLLRELVGRPPRRGGGPGPRPWPGRRRVETVPGPDSLPLPGARPSPSAQVHEEGASPARHTPDPLSSSGSVEEGGDGAGRPLPGHPILS